MRKTYKRKKRYNKYKNKTRKRGGNIGLSVRYGQKYVQGQFFTKEETAKEPFLVLPENGKLHTLIMWDPDASFPGWVHWIIINQETTLLDYQGPTPPSGIHRYIFDYFEQSSIISPLEPERQRFSILEFIKNNNLKRKCSVEMKVKA